MSEVSKADSGALSEQTKLLSQIATHPVLRRMLSEIEQAPPQDRLATAERLASVEALAGEGVEIPEGLRITTRYFENPDSLVRGDIMMNPKADSFEAAGGGTLCVSVGEIVCVSYGWEALQ